MTFSTSCSSGKRCSGQQHLHLFMAEIQTGDTQPLAHLGTDAAGVHRVDTGVERPQFVRCGLRETSQRPLRSRISGHAGHPVERVPLDPTLMIDPCPASRMAGITACIPRNGPSWLVSTSALKSWAPNV